MFKEINDIKCICETLIEKSEKIKYTADRLIELLDSIKSNTAQEDTLDKTLSMRKELSSLFILNTNMNDIMQSQQEIFDSLKNLT